MTGSMKEVVDDQVIAPLIDGSWVLAGATGSGKSEIACELALQLNGEVLSLDSMAVYLGMDLGTAKPSPALREKVPHHLIDLIPPTEEFSVSEYLRAARDVVTEVRSRGKVPIFVGGTPMWLKALIRGMYVGPPADWEFRREVEAEIEAVGLEALRQRLWQVDPLTAHKLHPHDKRRMIRALEVARATGLPISHQQSQFEQPRKPEEVRVFALGWPRHELHQRINQRVGWMFEHGLVEEVQGLLNRYGELGRTASQAVGYRETIAYLKDELAFEECIENVKAHTRQLARRQETWLRSLDEARWVKMASERRPSDVVQEIVAAAT